MNMMMRNAIPANFSSLITPQMMVANQEMGAHLLMYQQMKYQQEQKAQQQKEKELEKEKQAREKDKKILANHPFQSQPRKLANPMSSSQIPGAELVADGKLFKRSSYHVAIAYHIHIRNLKASGKELMGARDIDPTFQARKMREDNCDQENSASHPPPQSKRDESEH